MQETENDRTLFHHKACDTTDNTSIIKVTNQFVYSLYLRQSIIPKHKFPLSQIRFRRAEITVLVTHFFSIIIIWKGVNVGIRCFLLQSKFMS